MIHAENTPDDAYVLGRTAQETRRLQSQANFVNPWTMRLLQEAKIRPGMKILDLGSGAGDVALLLAELLGPQGSITGIDVNPVVLEAARVRLREAGFANVTFLSGNIETLPLADDFDVIVGRLILSHLRDPRGVILRLEQYLRPGGLMIFQEPDLTRATAFPSQPACVLWDQACRWTNAAFHAGGVTPTIGLDLYRYLLDAGLSEPHLSSNVLLGAGPDWIGYRQHAETIRSLLPLITQFGIATEEEIGLETLAERMREEALRQRSVLRGLEMISIWAQKASQGFS
ncbi:MAG TPA: class I SAM-dependent methyltransferase [Ktedonobacteraceae bacterium]